MYFAARRRIAQRVIDEITQQFAQRPGLPLHDHRLTRQLCEPKIMLSRHVALGPLEHAVAEQRPQVERLTLFCLLHVTKSRQAEQLSG